MDAKWPIVTAGEPALRGRPDSCFYCQQKVGTAHGRDCVCVTKRVKVLYCYEIEIDVPHHWDAHTIESHRNESSWCAENARGDIEEFLERETGQADGCPCPFFTAKFIEVVDETPRIEESPCPNSPAATNTSPPPPPEPPSPPPTS